MLKWNHQMDWALPEWSIIIYQGWMRHCMKNVTSLPLASLPFPPFLPPSRFSFHPSLLIEGILNCTGFCLFGTQFGLCTIQALCSFGGRSPVQLEGKEAIAESHFLHVKWSCIFLPKNKLKFRAGEGQRQKLLFLLSCDSDDKSQTHLHTGVWKKNTLALTKHSLTKNRITSI